MKADVKRCLICRQAHTGLTVTETYEDGRGAPRFRYVCPVSGKETSASGRPRTAAPDESPKPKPKRTPTNSAPQRTALALQLKTSPRKSPSALYRAWLIRQQQSWVLSRLVEQAPLQRNTRPSVHARGTGSGRLHLNHRTFDLLVFISSMYWFRPIPRQWRPV